MTGDYELTYEVWPFSAPIEEQALYERACSPRERKQLFRGCQDFADAHRRAVIFLDGVKQSPFVWQCPITAITLRRSL